MTRTLLAAAGFAALALSLSVSSASAAPMRIVQDAQYRNGPTVESTVIGSIRGGTIVEVGQCNTDFCLVTGPGINGYVGIGYLAQVGPNPPPQQPQPQPNPQPLPQPPQPNNPGPGFSFDFNLGGNGGFNNDDDFDEARVCFFDRANFAGKYFCAYEGDAVDALPDSWNDRISSIAIDGGLTVLVCRNDDFEGTCREIDSDIKKLPTSINDRISSLEVY